MALSGTFGGVIPTPALDRIAAAGLRYTQFHSTALCSPTRAALITGRNHHEVGYGVIGELSTGYPGYDSIIGPENATIGTILRDNGYATSWFGKDHNIPTYQYSAAGPFEQWPVGLGFEYFYGFLGGETDQWTPYLYRNTSPVYPWVGKPGTTSPRIWLTMRSSTCGELNAAAPDKPFFIYYVPGGSHSPHQPTQEWIDKFHGKFDMGWEKLREEIFANQKRLGVIPADTQLTAMAGWAGGIWRRKTAQMGLALADPEEALCARSGSVCRLYRLHRPRDRPRDSGGARTRASSTTRSSSTSSATTEPAPKARSRAPSTN